jgi:hypothetical protein
MEGTNLLVNLDARGGEVKIEVHDDSGQPIAGYSGPDAATAKDIDELRWSPEWRGTGDLSALQGKTVRLKFNLRKATLYAFQAQ